MTNLNYSTLDKYIDTDKVALSLKKTGNELNKYYKVKSNLVYSDMSEALDPILTIIIPTYQRSTTLIETIKSIAFQKPVIQYSLLIIDNSGIESASVEEKKEQIAALGCHRIEYYVNEKNIGMTGNWNRGLILSHTEYIAMLHDDDLLLPSYIGEIDKALKIIKKHNLEIGAIRARFKYYDGERFPETSESSSDYIIEYGMRDILNREARVTNPPTCGLVLSREAMMKCGGFLEELYPVADYYPQISMLQKGYRLFSTERVIGLYRLSINESMKKETMIRTLCLDMFLENYTFSHDSSLEKRWKLIEKLYYCNRVDWYLNFAKNSGDEFKKLSDIDIMGEYRKHGKAKSIIYRIIRKGYSVLVPKRTYM